MTLHSGLLALAISSIFAENANAYTCADLAADIARGTVVKDELGEFSSVDQKLTTIKEIFLESFPQRVAAYSYDDYKAKKIQNAYQASLITYRSMLEVSYATKELLDDLISKQGGITRFVTALCKVPKNEVQGIFQGVFLAVQKELGKYSVGSGAHTASPSTEGAPSGLQPPSAPLVKR